MNWREYLREIRIRGGYIIITGIVTMVSAYTYVWEMVHILAAPLEEAQLDYANSTKPFHFILTEITEAFTAATKLSIFVTIYALVPVACYQLWLFVQPGLYKYEKQVIERLVGACFVMSIIGAIIAYQAALPAICKFFLNFEMIGGETGIQINLEAKTDKYLSLAETAFLSCNILSQIPVVMLYCVIGNSGKKSISKIIRIAKRIKGRGVCYLLLAAISGIIAPTDIYSQLIMAIPIMLFYELSIYFVCAKFAYFYKQDHRNAQQ